MDEKEYLYAAATMVETQAMKNPTLGIPLDPDLADFMGAFEEKALSIDDLDEDARLHANSRGELVYEE